MRLGSSRCTPDPRNRLAARASLAAPAGWLPTLGGALVAYYDAEPEHVVLDGFGDVRQLLDGSGNGRDGQAQASVAARPAWNEVGALGTAGRPSLSLDGSGTSLLSPDFALAAPYTLFMVASAGGDPTNMQLCDGNDPATRIAVYAPDAVSTSLYFGASAGPATVGIPISSGGSIVEMVLDSTVRLRVDATEGTTSGAAVTDLRVLYLGGYYIGAEYWLGEWVFTSIYTGGLSAGDRSTVRAALRSRFGV